VSSPYARASTWGDGTSWLAEPAGAAVGLLAGSRLPLFAAGALVSAVVYAVLSAGLSE
jgi:hypothetical protein